MSDYEFWMTMAITVEAAETMPDYDMHEPCRGICALIDVACGYGLISIMQADKLKEQVEFFRPYGRGISSYFWTPVEWEPRVKAMYRLAEMAKGKS